MSEWRARWEVQLRWRAGLEGPRVHQRRVDTPAQLRAVITWARGHPDVTRVKHWRVRELTGRHPDSCRHGHPYEGGSATRAAMGWLRCECGGHVVFRCRWPGCTDEQLDPPPAADCHPTLPGT